MEKKYSAILFDADNTLLDFDKSERMSLIRTMEHYGVPVTDENIDVYVNINKGLWKQLEKGEITKMQLKQIRFGMFFESIGFESDADTFEVNEHYLELLGTCGYTMEYSEEICRNLKNAGYDLYIITNGVAVTQAKRLSKSGLFPYITEVFVSETVGCPKPAVDFFDYALSRVAEKDKAKILVVGDSLSSDIKGAMNAKLDSVWLNPTAAPIPDGFSPNYTVSSLTELEKLLIP